MRQPETRALALRVGRGAGDPSSVPGTGPDGASGCVSLAELPLAGLPWDLDGLIALAEPAGSEPIPAESAARLADAFRTPPRAGHDPEDPDALISELFSTHRRISEPGRSLRLTLVSVRQGRYWAAQAPGMPLYLLRDGTLLPVEPEIRHGRGDAGAELAAGRLRDGDALVLCSSEVHGALGEWDVREVVISATSPESAARKLVREAALRGAVSPEAVLLFAGVGPAIAHRLHSVAPAPIHRAARSPVGPVAALAGFAGALLGLAIGAAIVLNLQQPPPVDPELPASPAFAGVSPIVAGPPPPAEPTPEQPSAPRPELPLPSQKTALPSTPTPPAPLAQPVSLPAALPEGPPRHSLGPGLAEGVHLTLQLDPARGLTVRANQGALYSSETPQGVPVGEALTVPTPVFQRDRPVGDGAELRLCAAGQPVTSVGGDGLKRLLAGAAVGLPGIRSGDYTLRWWSPQAPSPTPAFLTLRVSGL